MLHYFLPLKFTNAPQHSRWFIYCLILFSPLISKAQVELDATHLLSSCNLEIVQESFTYSCDGADLCLDILNGTAPFTITIEGPNTPPNPENNLGLCLNDLQPGSYVVTVMDSENCAATIELDIPVVDYYLPADITNVSCNGASDGAIHAHLLIDIAPVFYHWEGPNGFTADTELIENLEAGTYSVSITTTDEVCVGIGSWEVTEPAPIEIEVVLTNPECGQTDGCLFVSGGSAPYYIWILETLPSDLENAPSGTLPPLVDLDPAAGFPYDPMNIDTAICGTNLTNGTYFVLVVDSQLCYAWESFTIQGTPAFEREVSTTNVSCNGANDGSICYSISGGEPPFSTVLIPSTNDIGIIGPEGCFNNLPAGEYKLRTTDGSGCTLTEAVIIEEPPVLRATFEITNTECDGSINACLGVEGGTTPYYVFVFTHPNPATDLSVDFDTNNIPVIANAEMIDWFDFQPGTSNIYEQCAENIPPGNYLIVVVDANGCYVLEPAIVPEINPLQADFEITSEDCSGVDGCLKVEGGTSPYQVFVWVSDIPYTDMDIAFNADGTPLVDDTLPSDMHPFPVDPDIDPNEPFIRCANDIPPGYYLVLVVDANLCYVVLPVFIPEVSGITLEIETEAVACFGAEDGTISLEISGGTAPYTILIDNIMSNPSTDTQLNLLFTNLPAGTYFIKVIDAEGCTATATATIESPEALQSNLDYDPFGTYACVEPSGGTYPWEVRWYDLSQNNLISNETCVFGLEVGAYLVSTIDANACTTEDILIIDPMVCSGGEANVDPAVISSGESSTFTLSNYHGQTIQWEFKTEFTEWLAIPGATSDSYTSPAIHTGSDKEIWVRARVTCSDGDVLYSTEAILQVFANLLLHPMNALQEDPNLFDSEYRQQELYQLANLNNTREVKHAIFPTLVEDLVNIRFGFTTEDPVLVRVLNSLGQVIYNQKLNTVYINQLSQIDGSQWAKGSYIIQVESRNSLESHQLIVQ